MPRTATIFLIATYALALATPASAQLAAPQGPAKPASPASPEGSSGLTVKPLAEARRYMVAAATEPAAAAGREILRQGGTAVDAMIATQLVLNLTEPQSSGLGGGGFLLVHDAKTGTLKTYDARETAPAGATPAMFLTPDGTPLAFNDAVASGLSVGVPGIPHLLIAAHKAHGKLPITMLTAPAIKLAEDGFAISPRLNTLLKEFEARRDTFNPEARAYFFDEQGNARAVGTILKNPAFAATVRAFVKDGADAFNKGQVADAIVSAVSTAPSRPGKLVTADLAAYQIKDRAPICVTYRKHRVCGMGPPSSGQIAIAQTLEMLEPFDLGTTPLNAKALHVIAEAQKLAYADRDRYVADPDTNALPAGLLDPDYIAERRALIDPKKAGPKAEPGNPKGVQLKRTGIDATYETPGTSHISIIDGDGNAVALTTTIENAFGSRLMAAGFLLNNQLTDFSFRPVDASGASIANAVAPGKRPRSSMSPTIVYAPDGSIKAVLGSAGGSRIPLHVMRVIIGIVDWRMDAQAAVDLAHFGSRNGPFEVETMLAGAMPALQMLARGHKIDNVDAPSGLHAIVRRSDGTLEGAADPRREGAALGD